MTNRAPASQPGEETNKAALIFRMAPWKLTAGLLACLAAALFFLLQGPQDHQNEIRRHKSWTPDGSHLKPPSSGHTHPFMLNYWYRYVHDTVKSRNQSNCYVCSYMPQHSEGPIIYAKSMNKTQAKCATSFGGSGYQKSSIIVNDTDPYSPGLKNGTCSLNFWIDFNVTKSNITFPFSVHLTQDPKTFNHSMCYSQDNGTHPLGNTTNCEQTAVHGEGAPVKLNSHSNGTYWVQGVAWLCSSTAYFVLPPYWTGTCAPIFISDHTFIITPDSTTDNVTSQKKRSFSPTIQPHDSVSGSDVPSEFKHWSDGSKVAMSLFPWVGVAKNTLRLETIDYCLGLFLNNSIAVNNEQNEEIDALRAMVIQNRMALDMLTAANGGVCVLLNNICCTYIPDNVHSPNMTAAMTQLKQLQAAMSADHSFTPSWLDWLFQGGWFGWLRVFSVIVLTFLLLLCIFSTCIIPCCRAMINKMVRQSFTVAYAVLNQQDPFPEEEEDIVV